MASEAGRILIAARDLGKSFGAIPVLRAVDLEVAGGQIVAVLGPNGTGKSTLLKIVAGVMRAARGSLQLFGVDCFPGRSTSNVLARIGYAGHDPLVYRDLSPRQNLEFFATFYDGGRVPVGGALAGGALPPAERAAAALERAGLTPVADRPTQTLSQGMLQRLALARATLHSPEVLLLDEPFSGLDPTGSAQLESLVSDGRAAGRATVLVAHDLALVARLATRAIVLSRGRVALDLTSMPSADALADAYRRATSSDPHHVGDRP